MDKPKYPLFFIFVKTLIPDSMRKIFLCLWSLFLILDVSFAQPAIQWQKCLGGTDEDNATSLQQTADGGYIVAGSTTSNDGDVTSNHGGKDYWLVKLDVSGNIQWQKCFGGTNNDEAQAVQQTSDGGYVIAGFTNSNDGDVTGNHGSIDCWIVKLDGSGNIQWQKCFGGTGWDDAYSVQQTTDGGYIVVGSTSSNDGDVTGNHGGFDFWIVRLNNSGTIQWHKCLGGTLNDGATSVQQTSDGGYIVEGYTGSNDGDVTGNHDTTGYSDYWLVKLDGSGIIQWQKCLGGTDEDQSYSVQQTSDGGYIVAGYAGSNDGDVTGNHYAGIGDYWIVKLDGSGNIQWQKCLGGTDWDVAYSVQQTIDGGYIVAGSTLSNNGNVVGNHDTTGSYNDYWIVKLNSAGNLQWQKCLGGTGYEEAYYIRQTADEGFIIAGYAEYTDGDVTGSHGNVDFWVVKLSSFVGIEEESNNSTYNISPNPFTSSAVISFSGLAYNATFSLYNLLGEKVTEATGINGERFEFNRSNLPSGVYVFEVREKDKSIARGKAVVY